MQWRRRNRGTPRQIGQAFPVDEESQQKKKRALGKLWGNLSGKDRSMRTKKFVEGLQQLLKPKEDRLMASEILSPNDVKLLVDRGLLEIDDSDEIQLTAKGIKFINDKRMTEKPSEYTNSGNVKLSKGTLTEQYKKWMGEEEDEGS